jgi:hypothetical protein
VAAQLAASQEGLSSVSKYLSACQQRVTFKNITIIILFNYLFIYVLSSTANGQLQSQHEYKHQQYDITKQTRNNKTEK